MDNEIIKYVNILNICNVYTEDNKLKELIEIMIYTFNNLHKYEYLKLKLLMNNIKNFIEHLKFNSRNDSDIFYLYSMLIIYNKNIERCIIKRILKKYNII